MFVERKKIDFELTQKSVGKSVVCGSHLYTFYKYFRYERVRTRGLTLKCQGIVMDFFYVKIAHALSLMYTAYLVNRDT